MHRQANMDDIIDNGTLCEGIETENGTVKFFGLGRKVVTVPVKIPPEAYKEAVRVFFNSPEYDNGYPIYTQMTMGDVNYNAMTTTAGDLLVNAL